MLSIQDETSAADTAKVIRDSGLVDEVYLGDARAPVADAARADRPRRAGARAGREPRRRRAVDPSQPAVVQETPFLFGRVAALEAPASCEPNRGGTAGSLLLVNHWVDTPPAPRVTIARRVNAHDFLAAASRAAASSAACSRTWSRSTSTARATRLRSSTSSTASADGGVDGAV